MPNRTPAVATIALAAAILAACGGGTASPTDTPAALPTQATQAPTTPGAPITPPADSLDALQAVYDDLAERLEDVDPAQAQLLAVTRTQWPDACLGVPEGDEVCAAVVTPGFEIVFDYVVTVYTYRTDETGSVVRFAGLDIQN